jgi:hypothetical protein
MFVSLSVTPIKLQELPSLPDHPSLSRFQDTGTASPSGKGEIKSRKSKKDIQYNGQEKMDKQSTTKNYTEKLTITKHEFY